MRLVFTESAWQDYLWFQERDRKLLKRINTLIKEVKRSPFDGIGKPEALKADLSGW
jgi:toxin YoeB